ncbi:urea carboxylase [Nocardiopsis terrae]|uniref:Urea carboxylase n=1 Tax=Nocardiopsis terrae TaxID=372655 RepID=A0ABR9HND3_9ACTN|nr:urea carboxylase [Nocardiopsis terrae]MBE1460537.1 urea carboxylase [Nocardiopsis terrae]GHC71966.1 urea carboxylase [Nocardiopsis terrae]
MFDSVLVANRGEIACRIIRSARETGLRTVAVYSDADAGAPHTRMADEAVRLGPAPAARSYLDIERVLAAAAATGAGAVHPGYGFLSESAEFAHAVEAAGLVFVGPEPRHLEEFGDKHTARKAAAAAGLPMVAGSEILPDAGQAVRAAERIGYPVILKSTSGGGGIGLRPCFDEDSLRSAFDQVSRMARTHFGDGGVFVERFVAEARHIEVQVFGDGHGNVVTLGDRDCSLQRRNQKVVEEAPAPDLPDALRAELHRTARELCAGVSYRSAGTVEFVYDVERGEASFLEVNTRLQVEHPVTEEIAGIDLVAWMLRLARGEDVLSDVPPRGPARTGHAVEARVYAEDPAHDFRPSSGLLTRVEVPADVRVDGWVETGQRVTSDYDPMLAKVIVRGEDRADALDRLGRALARVRIDGVQTNLGLLRALTAHPRVRAATHTTATCATVGDPEPRIEVERAGTLTTVQDFPGRTGYWQVGVPPSGAVDDLSLRLGNTALGNPEGTAGLECTMEGPALRFTHAATVCVTGAPADVTVDGDPVPQWEPVRVPAGALLDVGPATGPGMRTYVLFRGGLDVPEYLGSASTFTAGEYGGHAGRALRPGDVLRPAANGAGTGRPASGSPEGTAEPRPVPEADRPAFPASGRGGAGTGDGVHWDIEVSEGPHAAPEFLTRDGLADFYATAWRVHPQSARNGVRLSGPKQTWARPDGGQAGLHPSNVHDTAYSVGAVNLSGDTPVLLGPDGPSLGGFVCPVTAVTGARWKIGQLRPGDTVRFHPVTEAAAERLHTEPAAAALLRGSGSDGDDGVLARVPAGEGTPEVTYRRGGHDNLLVEYGPMVLDLGLRMRVHALMAALDRAAPRGIVDTTPGVRSLHLHTDPEVLPLRTLLGLLQEIEAQLPPTSRLRVPSRTLHLPMSFDDPSIHEAIARYGTGVRDDAPWNPDNIEFIRRINGLDSVDQVRDIVFDASYLVLGLGDVYLGAPAATPLDPRHRLVTTKYSPARTWTPEAGVGIGGAYLCVYGMESPGGYQLIGRTVPIWSGLRQYGRFEPGTPWLLRFFDRITWYPVGHQELLDIRADLLAGRHEPEVAEGEFVLADHERFLAENADSIAEFESRQATAFEAERRRWEEAGEFEDRPEPEPVAPAGGPDLPPGASLVEAPLSASVWKVDVQPGETVREGQPVVRLEAMKLEVVVRAPGDGTVAEVLVSPGQHLDPGHPLAVITEGETA